MGFNVEIVGGNPGARYLVPPGLRDFLVGDDGSTLSRDSRGIWTLCERVYSSRGYSKVWVPEIRAGRMIHRLVLETFIGPCPPGMYGLHKDDDKGNNRLDNLYWGTARQNMEDMLRNRGFPDSCDVCGKRRSGAGQLRNGRCGACHHYHSRYGRERLTKDGHADPQSKKGMNGKRSVIESLIKTSPHLSNCEISKVVGVPAKSIWRIRMSMTGLGRSASYSRRLPLEKQQAIRDSIAQDPSRSNRAIARELGLAHSVVRKYRNTSP